MSELLFRLLTSSPEIIYTAVCECLWQDRDPVTTQPTAGTDCIPCSHNTHSQLVNHTAHTSLSGHKPSIELCCSFRVTLNKWTVQREFLEYHSFDDGSHTRFSLLTSHMHAVTLAWADHYNIITPPIASLHTAHCWVSTCMEKQDRTKELLVYLVIFPVTD